MRLPFSYIHCTIPSPPPLLAFMGCSTKSAFVLAQVFFLVAVACKLDEAVMEDWNKAQ